MLNPCIHFLAILAAGLAFFAINKGSPVFTGTDRFSFLESVGFIPKKIFLLHFSVGFILGLSVGYNRSRKLALITLFLWYIAVVLMGDKFSAIFWTSLAFISGLKLTDHLIGVPMRQRKTKRGKYLVFAALILTTVPIFGYVRYHGVYDKAGLQAILLRRVAIDQGAVWHGTFKLASRNGGTSESSKILRADSIESPSGVNALMFALADYRFAQASREAGISFAMGYPAIVIHVFGLTLGFPLSVLLASFPITINIFIIILATRRAWLGTILIGANTLFVLQDIFLMGRTWKILGWQAATLLVLVSWVPFRLALSNLRAPKAGIQNQNRHAGPKMNPVAL
jgi:hypothetical protein